MISEKRDKSIATGRYRIEHCITIWLRN